MKSRTIISLIVLLMVFLQSFGGERNRKRMEYNNLLNFDFKELRNVDTDDEFKWTFPPYDALCEKVCESGVSYEFVKINNESKNQNSCCNYYLRGYSKNTRNNKHYKLCITKCRRNNRKNR